MALISEFNFFVKTKVLFGSGVRNKLFEYIQSNNYKCIGVIVDQGLRELDIVKSYISELNNYIELLVIKNCSISEPTYQSLEDVRTEFCDKQLQAVIGLGGGSALDMAKAMAVLVNNTGPAISYRGFNKMTEKVLPIIAIPTTAGTGSEITPNASFIDDLEKKKMGINGEAVRPDLALLDPELTLSCPVKPTISAAADSIVHATEAFVAKRTNSIARLFAREGFQQVIKALPDLVENLNDLKLRTEVMYGAFLSGVALMHSGTGPAAAMSYPLGVYYGVPHGIGGAIFLPNVVKLNVEREFYSYSGLIDSFTASNFKKERDGAMAYIEKINNVWKYLNVPEQLSSYEINRDLFVKETLALSGALEQNPVSFGEAEIRKVLDALEA